MRVIGSVINPLMVVMSVRDFRISWYWIHRVDFLDKLIIKYYPHHEAHQYVLDFIKKHPEYTHILIYVEDAVFTPEHVKLLIKDWYLLRKKHSRFVVSGYTNWDFTRYWVNITSKDLSREYVVSPLQYKFFTLYDVLKPDFPYPFIRVFFVGLPLTLIPRDVFIEWGAKPYKWIYDNALGMVMRRGIMFDLSLAIWCKKNNIPIIVDLRCLTLHFGDTRRFINLKGKEGRVFFIRRKKPLVINI